MLSTTSFYYIDYGRTLDLWSQYWPGLHCSSLAQSAGVIERLLSTLLPERSILGHIMFVLYTAEIGR